MKALVLLILCLLPWAAIAAPVRVTSGEHPSFTRLVLELQGAGAPDWRLGRTAGGYELSLPGSAVRYDLSDAFRLIPKTRLAALWPDPDSGNLRLAVGCACHAVPFELRPGVIVIDIRDGPAPEGTSFELSLDGTPLAPLLGDAPQRPQPRTRERLARTALPAPEWRNDLLQAARILGGAEFPTAQPHMDMSPLREALVHELAKGAAAGLIDLAQPLADAPESPAPPPPNMRIALGDRPGVIFGADRPHPGTLTAKGADCLADSKLDIANWAGDTPIAEQFADARSGLFGEFDRADPESIGRAVRFYLSIGFGAEALQTLDLLQLPQDENTRIWHAMALMVDGRADPQSVFQGMAVCDGAAALWAVLGKPALGPEDRANAAAVRRIFSALPRRLRLLLGPTLVERFMGLGDAETVRVLQASILRGPGAEATEVTLEEARLALSEGRPQDALAELTPLTEGSGAATARALLDQTKARLAAGLPITPETVIALEAMAVEQRGAEAAADLKETLLLARAGAGDFSTAFNGLGDAPAAEAGLWQILADHAPDDDFLVWAVLPDGSLPNLPEPLRTKLAQRLTGLGLGGAAERWLGTPPIDPVLAAQARLLQGDGRLALQLLSGSDDAAAMPVRLAALDRLGDFASEAALQSEQNDETGRARSLSWSANWAQLALDGPDLWRNAARSLEPASEPSEAPGALAQAQRLVDQSEQTRRDLSSLLAATARPL